MLLYLYQHRGRIVTREELYHCAYLGREYVPDSSSDEYEYPFEYRDVVDTTLWRLRAIIEPDPSTPVLIRTIRGKGIRMVSSL